MNARHALWCAFVTFPVLGALPRRAPAQQAVVWPDTAAPALDRRVYIASRTLVAVSQFFAHWDDNTDLDLDAVYQSYVSRLLQVQTRREFWLATTAFLAQLGNGHTKFSDPWIEGRSGSPLPFSLHWLDEQWVVTESSIPALAPGDIVRAIDGQDTEAFYAEQRRYIPTSTERWGRYRLFGQHGRFSLPLLPLRFTLALDGGREVVIDRGSEAPAPPPEETTGRWIDRDGIAYIRIPSFSRLGGRRDQERALELLGEFEGARGIVIDVRGNSGGATPLDLMRGLMDRPFPWWRNAIPASFGGINFQRPMLVWGPTTYQPAEVRYSGNLVILADAACLSACEDFLMPFKVMQRAVIVGEQTGGSSGQPQFISFEEGMTTQIGGRRQIFPDGSPFESVGIAPDIEVIPTRGDYRAGRDPALQRAVETLRERGSQ